MTPDQKVKRRQINEKIAAKLAQLKRLKIRLNLENSLGVRSIDAAQTYHHLCRDIDDVQHELALLEDEQENFYRHVLKRRK